MKFKTLLLICASGLLMSLAYIAYLFYIEGQMVFPKSAKGNFIQNPSIATVENISKIKWSLPEKCDYNSYEVREEGYIPNAGMLWGGNGASCGRTEKGFECQAELHPEMKGDGRDWVIQAYGYGCTNGNFYISKPGTGTF